jgi:hypothetical protein
MFGRSSGGSVMDFRSLDCPEIFDSSFGPRLVAVRVDVLAMMGSSQAIGMRGINAV